MSAEHWSGGCQCGFVRYRVEPDQVLTFYCCHCTECQGQASSAFGMSMKMPRAAFELVSGELARWQRRADSGNVNRASFCPRCGCRIYHDGGEGSERVSVKAGSLDNVAELAPVGHIWTDSAQPWVPIDAGLVCFPRQPPSYAPLEEAWRRSRALVRSPRD
jgi:hypothetical protein